MKSLIFDENIQDKRLRRKATSLNYPFKVAVIGMPDTSLICQATATDSFLISRDRDVFDLTTRWNSNTSKIGITKGGVYLTPSVGHLTPQTTEFLFDEIAKLEHASSGALSVVLRDSNGALFSFWI